MSRTEHQSLEAGPHPDEWVDGATCDSCQAYITDVRMSKFSEGSYWNIEWLKKSNEVGETAEQMRKEIYDGARESGRDIRHVGESASARAERNRHHGTGG